jgi:TonB family protein
MTPRPVDGIEPRFLLDWDQRRGRERVLGSTLASVLIHLSVLGVALALPREVWRSVVPQRLAEIRLLAPLVAPPLTELTQKEPNRGKVSKEIDYDSLLPKPVLTVPPAPRSVPGSGVTPPSPPPGEAAKPREPLPEPPRIEVAQNRPPALLGQPPAAAPPPQIQTEEKAKPKLAFERPSSIPGSPSGAPRGAGLVPPPSTSVDEAIRAIARQPAGASIAVGDMGDGPGGLGEAMIVPGTPGRQGSRVELLSDPMGIDFRPYLTLILASVRRNWFAVIPESVRLGRQGRVQIQFAISRDGRVPKLVIASPSGADALDRAAVASISASNPFPPLPNEFRGEQIRLQLTFLYNLRAR